MNVFSKFFLIILGVLVGVAGVMQLQDIAFELMNQPDTGTFFLGLFYLAIVLFIWGSAIYLIGEYLIKWIRRTESAESEQNQSNEQKPNN